MTVKLVIEEHDPLTVAALVCICKCFLRRRSCLLEYITELCICALEVIEEDTLTSQGQGNLTALSTLLSVVQCCCDISAHCLTGSGVTEALRCDNDSSFLCEVSHDTRFCKETCDVVSGLVLLRSLLAPTSH